MAMTLDHPSGHSDPTRDELDDLEFLKRGLLLGEGFQLYIVTAPSVDAREAIASALRNTDGLSVELVRADSLNMTVESAVAEAFNNARRRGGRPVVVMTDVEQDAAGSAQLFRRLNQGRNELIADVPGALIVLGSHHAVQTFRKVAPDTWSVRAADVEVGTTRPAATVGRVEEWPRLQRIAPPRGSDERTRLEHALTTLEHGDERGRIALRLAEVLEFQARDLRRVEALYRQAAAEILDPWLLAVARVNAGRQLIELGDLSAALDQLKGALRSEAMRDPSLRAYTNLSIAIALWRSGKPEDATSHLRTVFDLDSDKDLVADARLLAAEIAAGAGNLREALHHLDAAERVARQLGDQELLTRAQANIASIAARAGERARVEAAFRMLLSQRGVVLPLQVAWRLWRSGEVRAADTAWTALRSIAVEQGNEPALFEEVARQIYSWIVEPQAPQVDEWLVWLKDGPAVASPDLENWLAVLEGRNLLNAGHATRAIEAFSHALSRERGSGASSVAGDPSVRVAWIGALVLAGRDAEAQASLREALDGTEREPFLRYLGGRANDARTIDKLPAAEGAALLMTFQLLISWPPSPVIGRDVSPRPEDEWHR